MPITLPSAVAANELIQSAWGNAVVAALAEIDAEFVEKAGDTMTGRVTVVTAGVGVRVADTAASIDFYNTAQTTRHGILQGSGGNLTVQSDNDLIFGAGNAIQGRAILNSFLYGKSTADLAVAGVIIHAGASSALGSIRSTTSGAGLQNVYARHESAADANGEAYVQYLRGSTVLGSVTQVSTTGVAFNTTSDARLKTDVGLEPDDGLDTIAEITVHRYQHVAGGTPQLGVFAQEFVNVVPEAVLVGGSDPESDPWQVAYGNQNIIGHVLLAVQQLAARVADLEAA